MYKYFTVIAAILFGSCNEHTNIIKEDSTQTKKQYTDPDTNVKTINNPPANFYYGIPNDSLYSFDFLKEKNSVKEIKTKDCGKDQYVIHLYKLVDLEGASDPILNILLILRFENVIYKTVIASSDVSDVVLIEVNKDPCLFGIKYFSSPVGYFEYYVYDLRDNIAWKTQKLDELYALAEDAFNMKTKEYNVRSNPMPQKLEVVEKF